ncbi:CLUMA_CG008767, isoform A [Clunio marinus]|uniref:CLUMA_CG008767, isoform A n=1 Tax=Clunio marinus TaxID=568069 RepID=A0A1J1I6R6_9DIPT|nr:CLUMA_CG008767, isoform A [Clunio marinus]
MRWATIDEDGNRKFVEASENCEGANDAEREIYEKPKLLCGNMLNTLPDADAAADTILLKKLISLHRSTRAVSEKSQPHLIIRHIRDSKVDKTVFNNVAYEEL